MFLIGRGELFATFLESSKELLDKQIDVNFEYSINISNYLKLTIHKLFETSILLVLFVVVSVLFGIFFQKFMDCIFFCGKTNFQSLFLTRHKLFFSKIYITYVVG
jgi:hypothetical protein